MLHKKTTECSPLIITPVREHTSNSPEAYRLHVFLQGLTFLSSLSRDEAAGGRRDSREGTPVLTRNSGNVSHANRTEKVSPLKVTASSTETAPLAECLPQILAGVNQLKH